MKIYKFNSKSLTYDLLNPYKILISIIIVTITILVCLSFIKPSVDIKTIPQEDKIILIREYNEFTKVKFIEEVYKLNFKFPNIVVAQAMLETGNFTSNIFLENNNLFGMKEAKQRATLAIGTNKNHALYKSWENSLYDFALYYSTYLYKLNTEEEYYEYLKQNYAKDTLYIKNLKKIIETENL